ncbi:hypothetical protein [Wolbachia endosymbiont of Folsomia candida]|uniref:hypothetical protein n=1 Tax=Wolbachia endosymbiont of Folsomia candida TaxID=169402 RepID=UPI000AB9F05D|nr:hypothetical protein [Wolbachia endosymbiont of Folsomia candida]APR97935.1 hypothetical protein ASM33_01215 [Wolbachia endosymbiont of Folsomia candida]
MNQKLKQFLIISGYILLGVSAFAVMILFEYLLDLFLDTLHAFFLAKTSSEVLTFFASLAVLLSVCVACYQIHKICSFFTEKIASGYQSFKNENSDDNIFSEVYNDPTIGIKDKILFFSIYLIYCIQLPFLYCASKVSELSRIMVSVDRLIGAKIALVLINAILLIPVAILELIKYPLIKLFSPLGLNVKQLSFLFNVSDVGTDSQSVHTRSFEEIVIKCAKELKEKHGTPSNELDKEFKDHINSLDEFTSEQKQRMFGTYFNPNSIWRNWVSEGVTVGMTVTQAVNLVLTVAREQNLDIELLKAILVVRFQESNGLCGGGMFNRVIYSLSSLEAENNFAAQLGPQLIGGLARDVTRSFFQKYVGKHFHRIKVLKENFDDLYSPGSEVNLSNLSDEVKNDICSIRKDIKEFVFRELYIKFYDDYGQHIQRGPIKQRLRELITDELLDSTIYNIIDDVEIPQEPSTYFERVKTFCASHARFSAA